MKVAICTFAFPEFSASLAQGLRSYCEPVVLVPAEKLSDTNFCGETVTFPYSFSAGPFSKFLACREMVSRLLALKPDVVHFQGWSPLLTPFLWRLRRFPIVFSWHDPVAHSGEEDLPMLITQKMLVRSASRVVVLTEAMKTAATASVADIQGKLRVVPHGIFDYGVEGPEERPPELMAKDDFILFFGRVSPYKGVENLCEAFTNAEMNGCKLLIAGKHLYEVKIPSAHRRNVTMLDRYIPNKQMRYLFRHCRAVVLPYKDTTQSGVLMLAYAFGKAVIATDTGGMPEMIEDGVTGKIVPAGDTAAMTDALAWAVKDPMLVAKVGAQGLEFAIRNYGWERIARMSFEVYREALHSRNSSVL